MVILILLASLFGVIYYFHSVVSPNETITSYFSLKEISGDFKITEESYISIKYIPYADDEITFFLTFENSIDGNGIFMIGHNGKVEKKESLSTGIFDYDSRRYKEHKMLSYMLNFKEKENPKFIETFSCNLFEDKTEDVLFNLKIYEEGDILNNIKIYILGLSQFYLTYLFPNIVRENPYHVKLNHNLTEGALQNGIWIKGYNPDIELKIQEEQFYFGIAIAIIVTSIVSIAVDTLKYYHRT